MAILLIIDLVELCIVLLQSLCHNSKETNTPSLQKQLECEAYGGIVTVCLSQY